jgi:hypothetical protein
MRHSHSNGTEFCGSQAEAQAASEMDLMTNRTLPSPRATLMPPTWPDCVRAGSHWVS